MAMKEEMQLDTILGMELDINQVADFANVDIAKFMNGSTQSDNDDDTVDAETFGIIQYKHDIYFPPALPIGPPERNNFEGQYNFSISVSGENAHKNKFVYSHKLNCIYVDIGHSFSLQFIWQNNDLNTSEMYVRATPVFTDNTQWEKRVERCLQHQVNDKHLVGHVLRSDRADGTSGVYYTGDSIKPDSWLSVVVMFPPAASHYHAYRFVCKSACTSGINRRPIEIMFTLEDISGTVHGRQSVGIKVCSCPGRDMKKAEQDFIGNGKLKRRMRDPPVSVPPTKRLITPTDDDTVYSLPSGLKIIGSATLDTVLNVIQNMTELVAKADPAKREECNNIIADWKSIVQDTKDTKQ